MGIFAHLQCYKVLQFNVLECAILDLTVLPASAFEVRVAHDKQYDCIDVFCCPADRNVGFHYAYYYRTKDDIYDKGRELELECGVGASCSRNCLEENDGSCCERIGTAHYNH